MAKIISVEPKEKYFAVRIEETGVLEGISIPVTTVNLYKMWNNSEHCKLLKPNSIIEITGAENGKFGLVLSSFTVIKEGRLGLTRDERKDKLDYLDKLIQCNSNTEISAEIGKLFILYEYLFEAAPAASKHHHAYIGGLLQHTLEVLQELQYQSDIVKLAAILHDFGKIFEYRIDTETGIITYNEDFRKELGLEGSKIAPHIMWAYNWCIERGFVQLAQIVAGHHGPQEWGSLLIPQTKEAHLLFMADYKSSKLGKITVDLLEDEKETETAIG